MITVNKFQIQNDSTELSIELTTELGSTITSVLLWNMNDFKDYTKAININSKLDQLDNTESFIVTATELDITSFDDVWFIEIQSDFIPDNNCGEFLDPALAITYNLTPYYQCLLDKFLEIKIDDCKNCNESFTNDFILTINLLIEMIEKGIEEGYYEQIIGMITKLKKLCSLDKCNNCGTKCSKCGTYTQITYAE